MRDAFGGAFMINLWIIFLVIYISFMALALNYAKAFRVKNQIINYIEQYEGYENNEQVQNLIVAYLANANYYVSADSDAITGLAEASDTWCHSYGYCITKVEAGDNRGVYYKVQTFMQIDFPFFNMHLTIPIKGETRIVTNL